MQEKTILEKKETGTGKNTTGKDRNFLIKITRLSKQFEGNLILKDVQFSIGKGESVSIMGPSGAGKTTFLNIVLGLDKQFEGLYENRCKKIAAVFQEHRLLPWLNIYENLKIVNPAISDREIKELLDVMKLTDFASFPPMKLSGGMKQRAAIARALCYDADLIIMDEPLKSTDKQLGQKIIQYLKKELKRKNKSLIFITHDVSNALEISDKIYILENKPASFTQCIPIEEEKREVIAEKLNRYAEFSENDHIRRIPAHVLLARLGKKRLVPGGVAVTQQLLKQSGIQAESKVLEVSCNNGRTLIEIAEQYGCSVTGVDTDVQFLTEAKQHINAADMNDSVKILNADARRLPFEDESFDVVLNQTMLTMLSEDEKKKAVAESFRVLKKGGTLLTHDMALPVENPALIKELRKTVNMPAEPLTEEQWVRLFSDTGFSEVDAKTGTMTLLSAKGMTADEGVEGMGLIFENARKDPNFEQFIEMKDFFARNADNVQYIGVYSKK